MTAGRQVPTRRLHCQEHLVQRVPQEKGQKDWAGNQPSAITKNEEGHS